MKKFIPQKSYKEDDPVYTKVNINSSHEESFCLSVGRFTEEGNSFLGSPSIKTFGYIDVVKNGKSLSIKDKWVADRGSDYWHQPIVEDHVLGVVPDTSEITNKNVGHYLKRVAKEVVK